MIPGFVPLTEQQEEQILSEIGYSKEQLEKDLQQLKDWIREQQHLPPSSLKESDEFLKMFLTGCKGSLEKTKKKLDNYYTYRRHSHLLENRDPLEPGYSAIINTCCAFLITGRGENIERIFYNCLMDPDVEKYKALQVFRRYINILDLKLRLEGINTGHYGVLDCKGTTSEHLLWVYPGIIKECVQLVQSILPYRITRIFLINSPSIVDTFFNKIVSPFLSKKLRDRLVVTSKGPEILFKYIDKSSIPSDYGGDNLSIQELNAAWRNYELSVREFIMNELSEHTDESKRIILDNGSITDPFFGMHGSLKKLVID